MSPPDSMNGVAPEHPGEASGPAITGSAAHARAARIPPPAPRRSSDPIPLTYTQQMTWELLDRGRLSSARAVATAMRLAGVLEIESLRRGLTELVHRHEALRTRIVSEHGAGRQAIDPPRESALEVLELTAVPAGEREGEARRLAEALIREPVDVAQGPLFAVRLVRLDALEHVLILALDHLISDGASLGLLWRELWALYGQAVRGERLFLPPVALQFADYAVWQRQTDPCWTGLHGAYWRRHLEGAREVRVLVDETPAAGAPTQTATMPIAIGKAHSTALCELSRRAGATLAMGACAAYVAVLMRWCATSDLVLGMVSLERSYPQLRHTLGYFAAILYLRLQLSDEDPFLELLRRVRAEWAAAWQHSDAGRLAAQRPRPAFTLNPRFNWLPREFSVGQSGYTRDPALEVALGLSAREFEVAPRDDLDLRGGACALLLADTPDGIRGTLCYRADACHASTAERFGRDFQLMVESMVADPSTPVSAARCEGPREFNSRSQRLYDSIPPTADSAT